MRTHDFTATLQFGTVAAVDAAKHAVRVTVPTLDDIQTDWLPVVSLGAGGNQFYALIAGTTLYDPVAGLSWENSAFLAAEQSVL